MATALLAAGVPSASCSLACQSDIKERTSLNCVVASLPLVRSTRASLALSSSPLQRVCLYPSSNKRQLSVRAADGVAEVATEELVKEVGNDTFQPALEAAGESLVVLDMYTQWCGPCKLIAPRLEALAKEWKDVVFLKMDCNQANKPIAKSLGIQVVPTFKLFKNKELLGEIRGAKYDALLAEIEKNR